MKVVRARFCEKLADFIVSVSYPFWTDRPSWLRMTKKLMLMLIM